MVVDKPQVNIVARLRPAARNLVHPAKALRERIATGVKALTDEQHSQDVF